MTPGTEEVHMAWSERRKRVLWILAAWVVALPFLAAFWYWFGWFFFVILAGMIWATWDYYRKGGMIEAVEGIEREGVLLPNAFREDE
jgi:hypothetical protein